MTDEKTPVTINDNLAEPSGCSHISMIQHDSGYYFPESRRDIGLRCEDCGTEWDVQIKQGFGGCTIKLRSAFEMSEHTLTTEEKEELDSMEGSSK